MLVDGPGQSADHAADGGADQRAGDTQLRRGDGSGHRRQAAGGYLNGVELDSLLVGLLGHQMISRCSDSNVDYPRDKFLGRGFVPNSAKG